MALSSRLSREDWIAVAKKVLVTAGIDDVKVDRLARRLKMTRGSFYWHFRNRNELLDAILHDWQANNLREIAAIQARSVDTGAGMIELFRVWLNEDPGFPAFDMAIRAWARKVVKVRKLVRNVDEAWISLFQQFFRRSGMNEDESFVRARVMYFHQVGYYALAIEESLSDRRRLAPYYYKVLTGAEPSDEVVSAFGG